MTESTNGSAKPSAEAGAKPDVSPGAGSGAIPDVSPSVRGRAEAFDRSTRVGIDQRALWGMGAFLLLAVLVAYFRVLGAGFVYDDTRLVEVNPNVSSLGAALRAFFEPLWAFEDPTGNFQNAFWRPLTVMTLALGRWISGFEAWGLHALSLVLHGLTTLVAWRFASRLLSNRTLGFAVALVFALHPVHVESVAWIAAINDPLYALFALLALDSHLAWRKSGSRGSPWAAGAWLLVSLLAKEQALSVLPIALFFDLGLGHLRAREDSQDPLADLVRAYTPFLVALALYYAGRVVAYDGALGAGFNQVAASFELPWIRDLQFQVQIFGTFLELLFAPFDQTVFRQVRPELPAGNWPMIRATAFLTVWVLVTVWAARRRLNLGLAALLALPAAFSLLLFRYESAGAFPISDRYLYLPVVFAGVFLAVGLTRVLSQSAATTILCVLALAGGVRTFVYSASFHDEEAFFRAAVAGEPDNASARWGLGRVLIDKYRIIQEKSILDEAAFNYLVSLKLGTDYGVHEPKLGEEATFGARAEELSLVINGTPADQRTPDPTVMVSFDDRLQANIGWGWATYFLALRSTDPDFDLPVTIFENTAQLWPQSEQTHTGVGTVLMSMGQLVQAEAALREAVRLNPAYSEAWHNLGWCLAEQRKWDEARACYEQALVHRPGHLDDLVGAAKTAIEGRRYEIAERHLAEAERLHPGSSEWVYWRGMLEAGRGDLNSALGRFDRVLSINPDHPLALLQKGRVLIALGQPDSAVRALARACELLPDSFTAYGLMAQLLLSTPEGAEGAMRYLQRAYALSPPDQTRQVLHEQLVDLVQDDLPTLMALSTLAEQLGDAKHALDWIQRALVVAAADPQTLPSHFALLHFRRGAYLGRLRKHVEAVDAYRECLRLEPDHFYANHDLALILHYDLGRSDEARGHAQAALDRMPLVIDQIDPAFRNAMREKLTGIANLDPLMGPLPVIPDEQDDDGK